MCAKGGLNYAKITLLRLFGDEHLKILCLFKQLFFSCFNNNLLALNETLEVAKS